MKKLIFLTNFLPPYKIPILSSLKAQIKDLTILVSTQMEPNRHWNSYAVDNLDVICEKNFQIQYRARFKGGISDVSYVHIPISTLYWLINIQPKNVITGEMGIRTLQALLYRIGWNKKARVIVHADIAESTETNRGKLRFWLRRWILSKADSIIVNGKSGERYVRSIQPLSSPIFIIPYTTNIQDFAAKIESSYGAIRQLIYVGNITELKGLIPFLQMLIRWCISNPQNKINWTIVGSGPLEEVLKNTQPPKNLTLSFKGFIPYEKMPETYKGQDIFVFPTFADTWGLVVNEAMAAGLPVLGSLYSQAVEELVQENINGWIFYPDQEEQIYQAIDKAMNTPDEKMLQMKQNAQQTSLEITPERVANQIMSVIEYVENIPNK